MNIDNNLILVQNPFITKLFDLYDKSYFPSATDWDEEDVVVGHTFMFYKPIYKKQKVNVGKRRLYELAKEFIDELSVTSLTMTTINQFCDFVRVIEKCLFYINDNNNHIFVDSGIEDTKKVIAFKSDDIQFKIDTLSVKDPMEKSKYHEVLEIEVKRLYGKKMENKFTVVDREVKYNDDSDLYLVNTLNMILLSNMKALFMNAINRVYETKIELGAWRS